MECSICTIGVRSSNISSAHTHLPVLKTQAVSEQAYTRGKVGRVTDYGVKGLGFKSPGSILTSRIETNSLSRMVRDGGDPCSVPLSG